MIEPFSQHLEVYYDAEGMNASNVRRTDKQGPMYTRTPRKRCCGMAVTILYTTLPDKITPPVSALLIVWKSVSGLPEGTALPGIRPV